MSTNYLALRSSTVPALSAVNLTLSTLTGSTITALSTFTAPTVLFSTLKGSTMSGLTLSISTLTVSSINNGVPGVSAYSTLNVSTLNVVSTVTTSSINVTTGNVGIGSATPVTTLDVAGTIQGQTAFQSSASANNVGMGALQTVYLGQYGASAPRGTSVRLGDVLGAAYYVTTGSYNLSFYKDVSGGNAVTAFQIVGIGSTSTVPTIYIPNSLSIGIQTPTSLLTVNNTGAYQTNHLIIRGQEFYASGFSSTGIALNIGVNRSGNKQLWIMDPDLAVNSTNGCFRIIPGSNTTLNCVSTDGTTNLPLTISGSSISFSGGGVGIGTASPAQPLHVYGDGARTRIESVTASNAVLELKTKTNISYLFTDQSGHLQIYPNTSSLNLLLQPSGGNVGIGTASPQCQLHVHSTNGASGSAAINYGGTGPGYITSWNGTAGVLNGGSSGSVAAGATGIFCFNNIVTANNLIAMDFVSFSDVRIKKNIQSFDRSAADLINQFRIVSYDHVDYQKPSCGAGLVAQEIETVFPECIKHRRDTIPNIYCPATHSLSESIVVIQLIQPSRSDPDILSAKRISLRVSTDTHFDMVMDMDLIHTDGLIFHVKKWENYDSEDKVFVYGTEVEDFRVIDKEMVSMVAVRAIQEHDSLLVKQAQQIADLQTQLASLLSRLAAAGI